MDPTAWAALCTARYNRSPRQALTEMSAELRAKWHAKYCPTDDVDLRAQALVTRTANEMRTAGQEVTIRTVWITLAERCPTAPDDKVLGAAAALAGVSDGLRRGV